MKLSRIKIGILGGKKILNSDDKIDDIRKNYFTKVKKVSFCGKLFFLWTLDIMKLSNKGQLKKDTVRKSSLFTSSKNKKELKDDFLFLKDLWEGKDNKKGYKNLKISPIIITIARFNLFYFIQLIIISFIVQGLKMSLLYFKRRIIKLFF